jgi:hypothetical protein
LIDSRLHLVAVAYGVAGAVFAVRVAIATITDNSESES